MSECAVKGCFKNSHKNVTYYSLPTNNVKRRLWLKACNIKECSDSSIKICSLHFRNKDFKIQRVKNSECTEYKKMLRENAIPNANNIVKLEKSRSRTQKREIRSYVLATQRRFAVHSNFDKYSLCTLSNLALSSCRYNSALLYKICERDSEIYHLENLVKSLRRKNEKMKLKYKYWKKLALKNS